MAPRNNSFLTSNLLNSNNDSFSSGLFNNKNIGFLNNNTPTFDWKSGFESFPNNKSNFDVTGSKSLNSFLNMDETDFRGMDSIPQIDADSFNWLEGLKEFGGDIADFMKSDAFANLGSVGQGLGSLASSIVGYKNYGLNKDNLEWQKNAWNKQYEDARNAMIADQNMRDRVAYGSVEAANAVRANDQSTNYFDYNK